MYLPNVPPNAAPDYQNSTLNEVINTINQQQRTQVQNDGTSNRYLQGYLANGWPNGDFGIRVSAPGDDVSTAPFKDLLYAQDFTTGTQYFNTGGKTLAEFGVQLDGTTAIRIAKAGKDVDTATSDDLVFNSSQDIFKIVATGTTTIPGTSVSNPGAGNFNSNNTTVTVAHGQSSPPAVIAFLNIGGVYYTLPYNAPTGVGTSAVWFNSTFFVDATNVTFTQGALVYGTNVVLAAAAVRYYILAETAN